MHQFKIINDRKKIVYLKWEGIVSAEEAKEVTKKLKEAYEKLGNKKYYIIIDVTTLQVFPKETMPFIIEQQKEAMKYVIEVADLIPKAITKVQLEKSKVEAGNDKTKGFSELDEAILYLENVSIY